MAKRDYYEILEVERNAGAEEIKKRKKQWKRPAPKIKSGYAARYAQMVTSAGTGAVFKESF